MLFDPGIMEAAKAKGIKFVDDVDGNGKIQQSDLDAAIAAKKAGAVSK